jgi:hypothetical protein
MGSVGETWQAKAQKHIDSLYRKRERAMAAEYGEGLSLWPERDAPESPWLEWWFSFIDEAGRRRRIAIGLWPFISVSEAHTTAALLRAGDWRTVVRVMLRYGKLDLFESRTVDRIGESGLAAAIQREKEWVRYTSRAQHWPRPEKAEARRALDRLESLLGRVRGFAQARGLQLRPATSDGKLRAAA